MPIPKARTGGTAVRVVGSRQIPESMQVSEADLDGYTAEEVAEAYNDVVLSRKPAVGTKQMTAEQRAWVERMLETSSPSTVAVEHVVAKHLPADLLERVAGGHHALVAVIYDDAGWLVPLEEAFVNVLRRAALSCGCEINGTLTMEEGAGRIADSKTDLGWDLEFYLERLAKGHVLVTQRRGKELDANVRLVIDAVVDLDVTVEAMIVGLQLKHPTITTWPEDVDPALVTPKILDLSASRSRTVDDVGKAMQGMSRSIGERKAKEEAVLSGEKSRIKEAEKKQVETKSKTKVEILRPTSPVLDDLHVPEAFRLWCRDLLRDVRENREGRLAWTDVDAGCLLYGPPGTGKTMLVSALAASLETPFIPASFAQWAAAGRGYQSDTIGAMRDFFGAGGDNAPCLMFIDEIDSIPARGVSDRHDDYWRPIVNGLLELLDGTTKREGVIVIAATNDPSRLDPALVRSGRLDRRFHIGLPDEVGLLQVMLHHLPDADRDALAPAATALAGSTSPADVARIAREARRAARRQGRAVTAEDLLAIAIPPDTRPADLTRRIAIHEAGHAVAYLAYGIVPLSLSLVASGDGVGGVVQVVTEESTSLADRLVPMLAARAAEEVILGSPSLGAIGDLSTVTREAAVIVGGGLGSRLSISSAVPEEEVEALVRRHYAEAVFLVLRHRTAIETLANLAMEKRVLSQRVLIDVAAEFGLGVRR